jgi:hypothetical protein
MQVSLQSEHQLNLVDRFKCHLFYLEKNEIGSCGLHHLSKIQWKSLSNIYLSYI